MYYIESINKLPIENYQYAIEHYKKNQSLGRILLKL